MTALPDLLRRVATRMRTRGGTTRVVVRDADPRRCLVSRRWGTGQRAVRLDDPAAAPVRTASGALTLRLPDPAALIRLATAGLLAGELRRLRVRLADCPAWLVAGLRPPRAGAALHRFTWHRRGRALCLDLRWSRPRPVHLAVTDVLTAVVRARAWDQLSGPVPALDRAAWLHGGGTWPQGRLRPAPSRPEVDARGLPLGPYVTLEAPAGSAGPPVVTSVANPYGRRLVGTATRYRLTSDGTRLLLRDGSGRVVLRMPVTGPVEGAVASATFDRYAVVTVDGTPPAGGDGQAMRALAACGLVFAAADPPTRAALARQDMVVVADAAEVDDLRGYSLSVEAARRMAIRGDPALRRTALAGAGALPLPTVSVLLPSMRPDHIDSCLAHLAAQDYPALELLVGMHGYEVTDATVRRWRDLVRFPLRVTAFPSGATLGGVLGGLTRAADGELITKVDDDDHYGDRHVTDLVIAWHTLGADLVAKGARFVHLPEQDETIDRAWAAPEGFDVTPAGGTMLLSRGTLAQVGGWSHSSRHVDEDLLTRIRDGGGLTYRTHALEYVYVRRSSGHTFATGMERLRRHSRRVYQGLPETIIRPEPVETPG